MDHEYRDGRWIRREEIALLIASLAPRLPRLNSARSSDWAWKYLPPVIDVKIPFSPVPQLGVERVFTAEFEELLDKIATERAKGDPGPWVFERPLPPQEYTIEFPVYEELRIQRCIFKRFNRRIVEFILTAKSSESAGESGAKHSLYDEENK